MNLTIRTFALLSAGLVSVSALAQDNYYLPSDTTPLSAQHNAPDIDVQAGIEYSYEAQAVTKFGGLSLAQSDSSAVNLGIGARFKLNDDFFIPLRINSDNYFLGATPGAPVPDDIHTLQLDTGLGWRMNDEWTFAVLGGPALYRFIDIQANDIGGSGGILAQYKQNQSLAWIFGLFVAPNSDVPVLPVAGVHWQINDHYTLDAGMPRTRITYRLDKHASVFGGLNMEGATFRSPDNLGVARGLYNPNQYDNALGSYRDIRLGVGIGYNFSRRLRGEAETGASVFHEIDYKYIDQQVHFDPALYMRLSLNYRF